MVYRAVARIELDRSDLPISSGALSVLTNFKPTAHEGSITEHGRGIVAGSTTVFVENKPMARAGDLTAKTNSVLIGSPNVFASDVVPSKREQDPPVQMNPIADKRNQIKYSKPVYSGGGVGGAKPYFPGTPDTMNQIGNGGSSTYEPGHQRNALLFLEYALDQAKEGYWRETGFNGSLSNSNIINIWKELGYPSTGYWVSDQTPWCAGFVQYALKKSGLPYIQEASATNTVKRAKEFNARQVNIYDMEPGDIVLWNVGHINFCYTANKWNPITRFHKYTFVGGNQSPGPKSIPPVKDPNRDGDVTISYPNGWTYQQGGISAVLRQS